MASAANMFKASLVLLLSFVLNANLGLCGSPAPWPIPAPCSKFRCPKYDVIETAKGFEIRRFINPTRWLSTSPIPDPSIVHATNTGFQQLLSYTQSQHIEMTSPVVTHLNYDGRSYTVSFYDSNDKSPEKLPSNLHVETWTNAYAAVSRFGGLLNDNTYLYKLDALGNSIRNSRWETHLKNQTFSVVQYNAPSENTKIRVNEIWIVFNN